MENTPHTPPNDSGNKKGSGGIVKLLIVVLAVLIIVIILLLLKTCSCIGDSGTDGPTVLEPDYPSISAEPSAEPIESDNSGEKPNVSQGGGSMMISFTDSVTYTLSTGKLSLFYQNPAASTHNVVVQVILTRGEDEYLLSQSGILEPGFQVTGLGAVDDVPQLSPGGYDGVLRLRFYDPETGERAIVDTDIPCTITVTE